MYKSKTTLHKIKVGFKTKTTLQNSETHQMTLHENGFATYISRNLENQFQYMYRKQTWKLRCKRKKLFYSVKIGNGSPLFLENEKNV